MFLLKFILTNICGHFECFFGKNYLYCTWLGTSVSDKAKEMAAVLNVKIVENYPIGNFPRIKCNTNYDEFGAKTKIYHLPMDQQYDRTTITKSKGEFCAYTVKEAEDEGFRRAFRHRFKN